MTPVYVVDIIGEVVQRVNEEILSTIQENETLALGETSIQQISYHKSHFKELIETLAQADKSDEERFKKYPIIYLMRDFSEEIGAEAGVYCTVRLRVIIIHQTVNTYKIDEREEKVFKPVLYPIYNEFIRQLSLHKMINTTGEDSIRHTKTDRSFWGRNQQTSENKNALNDYVDAIDITNLELKINFPNC